MCPRLCSSTAWWSFQLWLHIGTQQRWWFYRDRMQEFFCSIPQKVLARRSRAGSEVPTMLQSSSIPQEILTGRSHARSEVPTMSQSSSFPQEVHTGRSRASSEFVVNILVNHGHCTRSQFLCILMGSTLRRL